MNNINELNDLMENIENAGTFSVSGKLSSLPLGLKINNIGTIALPFLETQAKDIITHCEQAPFGRGEETVTNTQVRNCWQLDTQYFEVTNPAWNEALHDSVQQIGYQLGLSDSTIEFEPYKLLVYEKGGFFKAHRDTEKMPNMFATLVINLPSEHTGGELIVSHAGQSEHYSFADRDEFSPNFVAFYADCYHEVKPISSGYRICLIYNLALTGRSTQPQFSDQLNIMSSLNKLLQTWQPKADESPVVTYLLEHHYTEKNLSLDNLKNGDYPKAFALLEVARKNNYQAYLCLVTYYRSSYGDIYGYHRYGYDDDLDESDFDECDVEDEYTYAHNFLDHNGNLSEINKIYLNEDDDPIIATIPLHDGPGRDVSISEATGNAGATKELWYQRGGIILWPKDKEFELIEKMGFSYASHFFKQFVTNNDLANSDHREKAVALAKYIIKKQGYDKDDLSKELIKINDIKLVKSYLDKKIQQSLFRISYPDTEIFMCFADHFGWDEFEQDMQKLMLSEKSQGAELKWMNELLLSRIPTEESKETIKRWLESVWKIALKLSVTHINGFIYTLKILAILDLKNLASELYQQIETATIFDDSEVFATAILKVLKDLDGCHYHHNIVLKFIQLSRKAIQDNYPSAPVKPKDWSFKQKLPCDCKICRQLKTFLPDPVENSMTTQKSLKREVVHLQDMAREAKLSLDIEILRAPPKFQGKVQKTYKIYEAKLQKFEQMQQLLRKLP